jgi:subtilisin-like proprotein convertase family protein
VKIMALKFLSAEGSGDTADAIECLNYATAMRQRGVNIKLTSNSWGGDEKEQAMQDAIDASGRAGMMFVVAAGNDGADNDGDWKHYPAAYDSPNIVSVAATDCFDEMPYWSNYGVTSVDLGAPGDGILSTVPNGEYDTYSGTSMATPHVAGVAALAWSFKPSATWNEIKDAILAGTDPLESLQGKVLTGGRLNAFNALRILAGGVPNSIAGTVYDDANHNGARDAGEAPLAGVSVYLDADDDGVYDASQDTYKSDDVPVAIPEVGKVQSRLTVAGVAGAILDVDVNLDISHTYESDLKVFLVAPGGTRVELFTTVGTSDDNFTDTTLDDGATTPITEGWSPFTGRFRPEGRLSDLNGLDPNGTWTLEVEDTEVNDAGALNSWSLNIQAGERSATTSEQGAYSFESMAPGSYVIRQVVPAGRTQTTPAGGAHRVVMEPGKVLGGRDFGDYTGTPPARASVVGRHLFYNHSVFDGNNPGADERDDNAIATDKEALLAGREARFGNLTSYSRGINGLMIDVQNLPEGTTPGVADFAFRVGNNKRTGDWATAPAPRSITVRRGAGTDGSDRISFVWDDGAVRNTWLQVTVMPTKNTGLAVADSFYFGNLVGETGSSDGVVNIVDYNEARTWAASTAHRVGDTYDFNRDGNVNAVDLALVRGNQGHRLDLNVAVIDILGSRLLARRRDYGGQIGRPSLMAFN